MAVSCVLSIEMVTSEMLRFFLIQRNLIYLSFEELVGITSSLCASYFSF